MRERRYRLWDNDNGEYVKETTSNRHGETVWWNIRPNGEIITGVDDQPDPPAHKDRYVLEEWTGLSDRNGKDAYYQDISKDEDGYIYVVAWDATEGILYLRGIGLNCVNMETEDLDMEAIKEQWIVGNVHENSGLLEE